MAYQNCFLIEIYSAFDTATVPPSLHSISNLNAWFTLWPTDFLIETVLKNGIKMYGDASTIR